MSSASHGLLANDSPGGTRHHNTLRCFCMGIAGSFLSGMCFETVSTQSKISSEQQG